MTASTPEPTTVRDEIKAMGRIVGVFEQLDRSAQDRIAGWVYDRYRIPPIDDTTGSDA